jgi:hypothetical protein
VVGTQFGTRVDPAGHNIFLSPNVVGTSGSATSRTRAIVVSPLTNRPDLLGSRHEFQVKRAAGAASSRSLAGLTISSGTDGRLIADDT